MNTKVLSYLKSNKKMVLLFLIGLVLIFAGNILNGQSYNSENSKQYEGERLNVKLLKKILSNIEGAGNVEIFVTYDNSGVTEYAYDSKTVRDEGESNEIKHVFSNKEPIITTNINAEIRGVIATATGADNIYVKNKLIRCIKAVTGVGYDRISVETGVK